MQNKKAFLEQTSKLREPCIIRLVVIFPMSFRAAGEKSPEAGFEPNRGWQKDSFWT
jgi:hypothetical protein